VLSALHGEPWRGSISGRGFHPSGGIEARVTASGDRTGRHARVRVGAPRTMYFARQSESSGVIIRWIRSMAATSPRYTGTPWIVGLSAFWGEADALAQVQDHPQSCPPQSSM
jgi:hypothetical protein